jgi:hypothetical protein
VDALARARQEQEQQRRHILHELSALDRVAQLSTVDVDAIVRDMHRRVQQWRHLLKRQTPGARQVVSELLDGRIAWTPDRDAELYRYRGGDTFKENVLEGNVADLCF